MSPSSRSVSVYFWVFLHVFLFRLYVLVFVLVFVFVCVFLSDGVGRGRGQRLVVYCKRPPGDLHQPCAGARAGSADSSENTKREPESVTSALKEKLRLEATRAGAQGTCLEILSCMVGEARAPTLSCTVGEAGAPTAGATGCCAGSGSPKFWLRR